MGTSCSSLRKNGKKDRERSASHDNTARGAELNGSDQRKSSGRSVDSLPYGKSSSPTSVKSECHNQPSSVSQVNGETELIESMPVVIVAQTQSVEETAAVESDANYVLVSLCAPSQSPSPSSCTASQAVSPSPSQYTTHTPSPSSTRPQPSLSPTSLPDLSHFSEEVRSHTPNTQFIKPYNSENKSHFDAKACYTQLFSIKDDNCHIIAISSDCNELAVFNIYEERAVRVLTGKAINQPKDLKMIDRYRALVLCNRELKLYNLDNGKLETKLKGVMNQKMPYFGLHDKNYAVALSRNRMYVNLMNLKTGDLETTFKVGEDRFLNSLLVSDNGNICVCGDETQKPFPLLVWDLTNRKLLYDLRIPHHEFITRLSAISSDGHYVVSVCKELNTSSPNFIIVYDLQSGTLFKKWKPECNSVSIAFSTQCGCIMNGVESNEVLVWDLSTGNKKYTLEGHTQPPDILQATENGNLFLSYDSTGQDKSIIIWTLDSGTCLTVFTPENPISCCRLSSDGRALIIGYLSSRKLNTILINKENSLEELRTTNIEPFGQKEFDGKVFDLNKD